MQSNCIGLALYENNNIFLAYQKLINTETP